MTHLFADPEFWVAIAAVIFVAIVWKPARKMLIGSLDERADRIRGDLDDARKLREEAEQLLAAIPASRSARRRPRRVQAIVAHAHRREPGTHRRAERRTRPRTEPWPAASSLAEERIAQAEKRALDEIRAPSSPLVDVAIAAAREGDLPLDAYRRAARRRPDRRRDSGIAATAAARKRRTATSPIKQDR